MLVFVLKVVPFQLIGEQRNSLANVWQPSNGFVRGASAAPQQLALAPYACDIRGRVRLHALACLRATLSYNSSFAYAHGHTSFGTKHCPRFCLSQFEDIKDSSQQNLDYY